MAPKKRAEAADDIYLITVFGTLGSTICVLVKANDTATAHEKAKAKLEKYSDGPGTYNTKGMIYFWDAHDKVAFDADGCSAPIACLE